MSARAVDSAQVHAMTVWLGEALATRTSKLVAISEGVAMRCDAEPDLLHFLLYVRGWEDGHVTAERVVPPKLQAERVRALRVQSRKAGKAQRRARKSARA